ncbi:FKBP-type peptidyl-prolyl cis-trans isomerase [Oleiharenicola sp. Vm1]|uniref:FKBP-type peptidyl-prolyl cis-trans isomerase n=1 Tax=Oleiharenicola sp. Vm1 TaxID=3398393 RepID=UPI0039F59052
MAAIRLLTFHYTLRDDNGRVLDTSRGGGEPLSFVEGAQEIVPGLEQTLVAMTVGERREVAVPPELGYGRREEELVQRVPRGQLPIDGEVRVGDQFLAGPDRHAPVVTVVAVEGDQVTLDANHPLAGATLRFDVELVAVRPATPDEAARVTAGS